MPFAFTEHGVTMLASVLRSERAIKMNIAIVEAFVALRKFSQNYDPLAKKLLELEQKYDTQFEDVFKVLEFLLKKDKIDSDQKNRKRIGY